MAVVISENSLTALADAVREKTGKSSKMTPMEMVEAIQGIEVGGGGDVVSITTSSTSTSATTLSFSGLKSSPKVFAVILCSQYTTASRYVVTSCVCDGSKVYNTTRYSRSSGTDYTYVGTAFTWSFNNGTLQIKSPSNSSSGGVFCGGTYRLVCL